MVINSQSTKDAVIKCVDEALNEELTEQATALEEQILTLLLELMGYHTRRILQRWKVSAPKL